MPTPSVNELVQQRQARDRWDAARSRNVERSNRLINELSQLIDSANPTLQHLAIESGVNLSNWNPSRTPQIRMAAISRQGHRRQCLVESFQWSDFDLNDAERKRAARAINERWLRKIRAVAGFLERNNLSEEAAAAEPVEISIVLQMIDQGKSTTELIRWLQRLKFQSRGWHELKSQLTTALAARQCAVCSQTQCQTLDDEVCSTCEARISKFQGFCLLWDAIPEGDGSQLVRCAKLKEKVCRHFNHRQFTRSTLVRLCRWHHEVQPDVDPASVEIQEVIDQLESRTPVIERERSGPTQPHPPQKLLDDLSGGFQRVVVRFLWDKRRKVRFDALPDALFREGNHRSATAVVGQLKRLKSALEERYHEYQLGLSFDKREEVVELIHSTSSGSQC